MVSELPVDRNLFLNPGNHSVLVAILQQTETLSLFKKVCFVFETSSNRVIHVIRVIQVIHTFLISHNGNNSNIGGWEIFHYIGL